MKIGVFATFMSPLATPQMIGEFGRRAESIGLDFEPSLRELRGQMGE